jgi:hypothetical protein
MKRFGLAHLYVLAVLLLGTAVAQEGSAYWLERGHASYSNGSFQEAIGYYERVIGAIRKMLRHGGKD